MQAGAGSGPAPTDAGVLRAADTSDATSARVILPEMRSPWDASSRKGVSASSVVRPAAAAQRVVPSPEPAQCFVKLSCLLSIYSTRALTTQGQAVRSHLRAVHRYAKAGPAYQRQAERMLSAGAVRQRSQEPGRSRAAAELAPRPGGTSGADDGVGQPGAAHGGLAGVLVVQRAARVELHDGDVRLARRSVVADARVALHAAAAAHQRRSAPGLTPLTRGPLCAPTEYAHAHA